MKPSIPLLTVLGLTSALTAQSVIRTIPAPAGANRAGAVLASAGDVDDDRVNDLLIGDPANDRVFVVSGATGAVLRTHTATTSGHRFGFAVTGIEDVNLDDHDDYAIGAPDMVLAGQLGRVFIYSGADGSLIRTHTAAGPNTEFGATLCGGGDVNGDGWPDYVVGEPFFGPAFAPPGQIHAYSGRDGSLLFSEIGSNGIGRLGFSLAMAGDVDGDFRDDVLTSEPGFGQAVLYSGDDQTVLSTYPWVFGFFFWGEELAGVGDVDADGTPDVATATTDFTGYVRVYSGADGSVIHDAQGTVPDQGYGRALVGLGDLDFDGHDDYAVATSLDDTAALDAGRVSILSGATGTELFGLTGPAAGAEFGSSLVLLGDTDGDGSRDLAIGAPGSTTQAITIVSLNLLGVPGNVSYDGPGCATSAGNLLRLRALGEPLLGGALEFRLTGSAPSTLALLNLGLDWYFPLNRLAPGCALHAYQLDNFPMLPVGGDAAALTFPLPNIPAFAGVPLSWQGLVVDPGNNTLGIALSNGMISVLSSEGLTRIDLGNLGNGVVAQDGATGTGYLMYSEESVHTRFNLDSFGAAGADHFVTVRYDSNQGSWVYDTNSSYVAFTPRASDFLAVSIDSSNDTATTLQGSTSTINGLAAGYINGDLVVTPNRWGGSSNNGEWGLAGTFVER